ncbi:MAG TPA: hypothetical protein VD929_05310 [Caulobacteraceae bacterium]|nr:hypothetical protein [Caulobacteraceae bacterium]
MRRLFALTILLLAAACGRDADEALLDSRIPPSISPRFYPPEGWAWEAVDVPGARPVRYGVAAPALAPKAHVVLLAGWNEPAEVFFETARDLNARGFAVWALDPAPTPQAGAQAVDRLIRQVVRPASGQAVTIAAHGSAAPAALLALQDGAPADGLLLWDPRLNEPLAARAREKASLGLGGTQADGEVPWRRPDYDLTGRATLPQAWALANPDLRPKPRTWNWFDAQGRAIATIREPARKPSFKSPIFVLDADQAACAGYAACVAHPLPSRRPHHLAADPIRTAWLAALTAFAERRATVVGEQAALRAQGRSR